MHHFLNDGQSNISQKNVKRLEVLAQHPSSEVKELAILLPEIALVKPHKRRRWKFLAQRHPDLLVRMRALRGDDFPRELQTDLPCRSHLESETCSLNPKIRK
jgi:hypothetical protein